MTSQLSAADLARLRRQAIATLTRAEGRALLGDALERDEPLLVPAKLDLSEQHEPSALLRELVRAAPERGAAPERREAVAWAERLAQLAAPQRRSTLSDLVRAEAAGVLHLPSHAIADAEPLRSLGLDSLMALELGDRLAAKLQLRLPGTLAFDHPTLEEVVQFVDGLLAVEPGEPPRTAATSAARTIDGLSDEELVTLVKSM